MKLFVITSFLLLTIASSATAQNFQPFRNKYIYQFTYKDFGFYSNEISGIHSIQVDSAALIKGDSVFYFNKLNTTEDNFWGNAMIEKSGGEYLFLIKNDTVIIKTQLAPGSQWTFKLNNILYTVTYDHYVPETILTNKTDVVQTYIVENNSGFKDSIKIAENSGLVYSFPFSKFDYYYLNPQNFNLTYIYNTKSGVNFLNFFEYFNYDLGDILEYNPYSYAAEGFPYKAGEDIYKVISKTISPNGDTVTYSLNKCHVDAFDGKTYTTTQKTPCIIVVTDYSVTHNIPYFPYLTSPTNKNLFLEYFINGDQLILSNAPHLFEGGPSYNYKKGIGCYKYEAGMHDYNAGTVYKNILYSKQSNTDDECALEIILDTKTLHASSANLVVAPNPFDHTISLNATNLTQGSWTVRIVSALGVEVYTSALVISSSNQQIDLANLTALNSGIYFLSLENESQVYSQKIVKK